MPYTIQFENQPSAQAAASEIRIANPLPPELDWTSLQLNDISFGGVHIRVPDGLSHYEGRVPYAGWTWNPSQGWRRGQTPLYVDVAAGIDVTSGLFSVRLTCSDTNTGLLPDDPYAGFLPPNRPELTYSETNGCCGAPTNGTLILPGQGFVSYTIKPKANLATGTRITNAADIYFDFNDLIATPPIFNTIDAGAPASSVLPLPPQNGRTFLVQWVGQDDAGGSGIQSYDVYVSSTGSNYMRWLERTTATSAYFVGELGRTYRFYSFARDWVGHEEAASGTTQAQTTVLTNAPVLQTVSDLSLSVGQPLSFTNTVQGTSVGSLLFTVSSIPQSGAAIGSTNGVLRWTPTCSQGNTTNRITVWVQDTARTNVLDTITFTVTVRQCVLPQLGQLVLETGDSGRVPVHLVTTVPLISLNVPVELPADRFVYPGLEIIVPEICTNSVRLLTNSTYLLSMSTCSNMSLMGTQQVAWLYFTAATNQSSAFVTLQLGQSIGTQPNGTFVTNYIASPGRVVVVGREPLLEAKIETNRQPVLLLYAKPGSNYVIEANADLGMSNGWQPSWQGTMTNLWQTFQNPGGTNRVMFFRARTE